MNIQRLEKKFVYNEGDTYHNFFLISGMFKNVFPKRVVNSIYFDTEKYKDVWDNINGFGNRRKLRLRWYDELKNSHFPYLVTLGQTIDDWKHEIAAMWRFTKTNSITEGFHRKMKLIQRRAYGFSNFDNYRLRVKVLCSKSIFILT